MLCDMVGLRFHAAVHGRHHLVVAVRTAAGARGIRQETHAYSVAWADHEIDEALGYADKIIFNSLGQLDRFGAQAAARGIAMGLRLNRASRPAV